MGYHGGLGDGLHLQGVSGLLSFDLSTPTLLLVCVHLRGLWLEIEFRPRSCWLQFSHHTQGNRETSAGLRGLGTLANRPLIAI